jgi:hypothetical protein
LGGLNAIWRGATPRDRFAADGAVPEKPEPVSWLVAASIARILAQDAAGPPAVYDDAVLFIVRHDACVPGDGGVPDGGVPDGGVPDGGTADGGVADAGVGDGGGGDSGSCTQGTTTMVVQPEVSIGADSTLFAAFFVTPGPPVVELVDHGMSELGTSTGTLVYVDEVEVVDPSLGTQCGNPYASGCGYSAPRYTALDGGHWDPPDDAPKPGDANGSVSVDTLGPYAILRARPTSRAELAQWLDTNSFGYTVADLDAIEPYIARGYTVVAARISVANAGNFRFAPLALTWSGTQVRLPLALNATRDAGDDLTVYIAADDGTYQVPGASIVYGGHPGLSDAFVTRSILTIPAITSPDSDPVATRTVTPYYYQPVEYETVEVKVPRTVDCSPRDDDYGCCSSSRRVRSDMIVLALAVMFVIRRRRRR